LLEAQVVGNLERMARVRDGDFGIAAAAEQRDDAVAGREARPKIGDSPGGGG
jgi:hypothetical protein